jgi:hypothetical protein
VPAIIRRKRDNGVISYLTKPLSLTELGQLLDTHLAAAATTSRPAASTAPASTAPASGVAFGTAEEVNVGGAPGADGSVPGGAPAPAHRPGRVRRDHEGGPS